MTRKVAELAQLLEHLHPALRFLAREVRSARTRADMQRVQERLLAMLSDRLGGAPVS